MDLTVGKHYRLIKKLNSGSFGEIFLAVNLKNNREVAVKLQPLDAKNPQLQYEAKLLAYLLGAAGEAEGFPSLYHFGKDSNYSIMVIDLLGPSLEDLFQRCDRRFDLKTTVMVGLQVLDRLEYMHGHKFIHRDIKPQNFLLGTHERCGTIHIIDYGLSKKYLQKDGAHIPYRDNKSLTGTPRYASINSHLGIEQGRRDDLESVMYMLIYFLKGCLPWQNLKTNRKNYGKHENILEKKLSVSTETLTQNLPKEFQELICYTRSLHFTEQPDYNLCKKLLEQALLNEGIELEDNDVFCWEYPLQAEGGGLSEGGEPQDQPHQIKKSEDFQDFQYDEF